MLVQAFAIRFVAKCIQTRLSLSATDLPAEQLNRAALASYLRVVLSGNEFLYVD